LGAPFARFPTHAWESERVRLAAVLEESHWASVAKAYDRVQGYNWRYEAGVLRDDPAEREAVCGRVVDDSVAARDALEGYVRGTD
jgi:hypothetical protein